MLESFAGDDLAADFSLDDCFCAGHDIVQRSLDEAGYVDALNPPLMEMEAVIRDGFGYDARRGVHL